MSDVTHAVAESASTGQIVTLAWTEEREAELITVADDHVDANGTVEAWADDPESNGMLWRVHLSAAVL